MEELSLSSLFDSHLGFPAGSKARVSVDAFADCVAVVRGAERRVHLGVGVVALDRLVGQGEVVRGGLGGDAYAAGLGLADQLDGAPGRDVLDVDASAGVLGEEEVACDHDILGDGGDAGEAEPSRDEPFVHGAAA